MSVKVMAEVWGLDLRTTPKLVLLALSDHADDDGKSAYPSVDRLAWKCGLNRRTVQRTLRELEAAELIVPVAHAAGGRGKATEFHIHTIKGVRMSPFIAPGKQPERVTSDPERVTSTTLKGDTQTTPTISNHPVTISKSAAPAKRPRDLTFEAVADVCGWELHALTKQSRGWINGALPELRRLDATPDQIKYHAGNYFLMYGKRPTPSALVKHWPATTTPPLRASSRELDRHSERERLHASREAAALKETG